MTDAEIAPAYTLASRESYPLPFGGGLHGILPETR